MTPRVVMKKNIVKENSICKKLKAILVKILFLPKPERFFLSLSAPYFGMPYLWFGLLYKDGNLTVMEFNSISGKSK